MKPKDKAKELSIEVALYTFPAHETADAESMRIGAELGALKMHEWTKQQMIEKVLKFLDDNFEYYSGLKIECLLEDFKKAMEEI